MKGKETFCYWQKAAGKTIRSIAHWSTEHRKLISKIERTQREKVKEGRQESTVQKLNARLKKQETAGQRQTNRKALNLSLLSTNQLVPYLQMDTLWRIMKHGGSTHTDVTNWCPYDLRAPGWRRHVNTVWTFPRASSRTGMPLFTESAKHLIYFCNVRNVFYAEYIMVNSVGGKKISSLQTHNTRRESESEKERKKRKGTVPGHLDCTVPHANCS